MDDLLMRSATALAQLVRDRQLSPVELVSASLDAIERGDGRLNSIVTLEAEAALDAARRAEVATSGAAELPPFHGVPTAIKDLHLTAGMRTTFGTQTLAEFVPDRDDEAVARLRSAGFIVLGKTNVPEFGTLPVTESRLLGPCRNPWDLQRTPGGSSGGAAAAVAAGFLPVAHGSDGGGSVRIPASNCGLFGVKPARGRISNAPLFGDRVAGLSTTGTLTRFVEDAAGMLDCMAGYATGDPHWAPPPERPFAAEPGRDPGRLRVGLATTSPLAEFDAQCVAAAQDAARLLESLGHTVEPFEPPVGEQLRAHFELLWAAGVTALPIDPDTLEPFNAGLHARGRGAHAGELLQAVTALQQESRRIVGAALAYDVVLSPTLARPPLRIGELDGLEMAALFDANVAYVGYTPVANITGQPAVSLPLGWSSDGLPLGVMVTGRPADEATLLRLAGQLQQATDWTGRRPPLADGR